MKEVKIKYNPFLLETVISIDGKLPKKNSALHFEKQRIQEWADKFPGILYNEYNDANINLEFTGTLDDYTDLKEALLSHSDIIVTNTVKFNEKDDVATVEDKVVKLYEEIQYGPIDALKDPQIINAFNKATNALFEVNVVAPMSSGKSSLINAILGKKLMPMAQLATTATIVRIYASNQEYYSAIAYDKCDNKLFSDKNISYETMKQWNNNENISSIDIYGPVPCVDNVGMRLVIVDTPGPNNARDERHKAMTYSMLQNSDKSLVLFVLNAAMNGTDDENACLNFVCECMKSGGKQSRDRFIFALNKLDLYGEDDDVKTTIENTKNDLDNRDIKNPNIFPSAALPCLEIRDEKIRKNSCISFKENINSDSQYKFDQYYYSNHLPSTSRIRLENTYLNTENPNDAVILHSGVPSIEEAIRLYVNKYARTIKINDLVASFNKRLQELKAVAVLQKTIRDNKQEAQRLTAEIKTIQSQISSGKSAKEYVRIIDEIDVLDDVKSEVKSCVENMNLEIDKLIFGYNNKTEVPSAKAKNIILSLQTSRLNMTAQLCAKVEDIFNKTFKHTFETILAVYRKSLSKLGVNTEGTTLGLNLPDFIGEELDNLDTILEQCTSTVDRGKFEGRTRQVSETVERSKWNPARWFGHKYKTVTRTENYQEWVPNNVEVVNMAKVVAEYFVPIQNDLESIKIGVPKNIKEQTDELKETLKNQLLTIESTLASKLEQLQSKLNTAHETEAEIIKQESDLNWMQGIISRVNDLINY